MHDQPIAWSHSCIIFCMINPMWSAHCMISPMHDQFIAWSAPCLISPWHGQHHGWLVSYAISPIHDAPPPALINPEHGWHYRLITPQAWSATSMFSLMFDQHHARCVTSPMNDQSPWMIRPNERSFSWVISPNEMISPSAMISPIAVTYQAYLGSPWGIWRFSTL